MPRALVNGGGRMARLSMAGEQRAYMPKVGGGVRPAIEITPGCLMAAKAGQAGLRRPFYALRFMLFGLAALGPRVQLQHAAEVEAAADVARAHVARPVRA